MNRYKEVESYIFQNWDGTVRSQPVAEDNLLALPYPFTVSCITGAFNEMYYWDTYFTNRGLLLSGRLELAKHNCENIAHMIRTYGYMPNGTRTFYIGRSQPPYFALMVADEEMLAASASSGTISIRLQTWNAASIQVDDIVVTPMVGYTVEHKYGDTVLKSDFLKGEAGSTTAATATDILGFVASGEITQTTVAADNSTIVVVNYTRDIIVYTPYQAFYILLLPFDYTKSFPTGYCQLFS